MFLILTLQWFMMEFMLQHCEPFDKIVGHLSSVTSLRREKVRVACAVPSFPFCACSFHCK